MGRSLGDVLCEVVENAARGAAEGLAENAAERAYSDRNVRAVAFVVDRHRMGWDAGYYDDETDTDYPVVWATLPTGQVSWHVPPEFRDLLEQSRLPEETPVGGYDGHDRDLKNHRVEIHALGGEERITRDALPPA